MEQDKKIDTFKPYDATQISFLNRGKGINAPDVQAAIEEVYDRVSEADHLHRGRGENSVRLGPGSSADAESSVAIGDSAYTAGDQAVGSVALGARSGAHGERSIAIGDGANSFITDGIAIGASALNHDVNEEARDAIAIGTSTYARNQAVGIGAGASAIGPQSLAIGVDSQSNGDYAIAIGTQTTANRNNTISIGREAEVNANDSVAIGYQASANTPKTVAIGYNTQSNAESGIALGDGAEANSEASIAIGKDTITGGGGNIALGKSAVAFLTNAVAIGTGASAQGYNSVAIGPGANVEEDNTIVIGTPGHIVIIPGELRVLGGVKSNLSWIAPSDEVIAEISTPLRVTKDGEDDTGVVEKSLTLRNPGRYRIKGYIAADTNGWAQFDILENGNPIVETVFVTGSLSEAFSLDFIRDIGVNTTLTVRLQVGKISYSTLPVTGTVWGIRICGTETDIGNGVIGW